MDEMQNFTSEINNQKPNSCLKWFLVGFIGMVVLIAFAILGVEIIDLEVISNMIYVTGDKGDFRKLHKSDVRFRNLGFVVRH